MSLKDAKNAQKIQLLKAQNAQFEQEIANLSGQILALTKASRASRNIVEPNWLTRPSKRYSGVPTLFLSDIHYNEVVDPNQINGVNEYNIKISEKRIRSVVETFIDVYKMRISDNNYPGVVLALGGDIGSGDIHNELIITNEMPTLRAFRGIQRILIWVINQLQNAFGKVFVVTAYGNHGRYGHTAHKPSSKDACYTNLDWLLYDQLAMHFEDSRDVVFKVSTAPDVLYRIYDTGYLLTHGNQFRGGSGISGPILPWMLGDSRKRKKHSNIRRPYDYMLMGHWHQLAWVRGVIVNGSVKGYDEYADQNNFDYEVPRQAAWMTHPVQGIVHWTPINAEHTAYTKKTEWVSWSKSQQ